MNQKSFFICEHCGNIIEMVNDKGVPVMCCGQKMTKLEAGVVEASKEKHIPLVTVDENNVKVEVGSVAHPMVEEHSILWVCLQTNKGSQLKYLEVGEEPTVTFAIVDEEPIAAYAYCNLHGLWKVDIEKPMVCNLKPVNTKSVENYVVCNCNNVSYFDILDALNEHSNIDALLEAFDEVKNTTHCTTGCGGCYNKVIEIISDSMSNK